MLRYITAGESHGKALMAILDGMPAGLLIDEKFINIELTKRMAGYGRSGRMNIEKDKVDIIAGLRRGITIGSPIGLIIQNKDYKIDELGEVLCPRPGHADLAGMEKYGFKDARSVLERSSARETAARVAIGALAKILLENFGISILSHVTMIGGVEAETKGLSFKKIEKLSSIKNSSLRCADKQAERLMISEIDNARINGDTLGGAFEVIAEGVPSGLGSYREWDTRLDGLLARAIMSIPGVKAVSIGNGIECAGQTGFESHDAIYYDKTKKVFTRRSNNAGGLEGGVTNGQSIIVRGFMKPIPTLGRPLESVNVKTKNKALASKERADICAVPSCSVVAEATVAFELASSFVEKFSGDSIREMKRNYKGYLRQLREM